MKTLLILVAAIVLSCGAAWGEYMVVHAPEEVSFPGLTVIDPGFSPYYKSDQAKRITARFSTLKEALEYINNVKPNAIEVYKIEPVNLKQHKRVINRKVVEDTETQWTLEGEEPVWRKGNEIIWISPKEDFSNVSGYPTGVTIFTRW